MKKTKEQHIEKEINQFLEHFDFPTICDFIEDTYPIFELYNVEKDDDWVKKAVGGDDANVSTIRLVRTVYLMSKFSDKYSGKISSLKSNFAGLWKRMELLDEQEKLI